MATDRIPPPGSGARPGSQQPSAKSCDPFAGDFGALKERQLVFLLARQLADAQFRRGDRQASERLWQEVAALDIDPERITALLYGVDDLTDMAAMEVVDRAFRVASGRSPRGWLGRFSMGRLSWGQGGVAHRSAPPAKTPARPPAG